MATMPDKHPKRPRDPNQLARAIIDIATGEKPDRDPTPEEEGKDPAAVALGKLGGASRAKALSRKKRATPPVAPIFDGEKEAKLIALACSSAPPGHARWTLRLLEDHVVEREIVDRASDNTIGRVLKKTNLNLIAKSGGLSRRSKTAHS